MVEALCLLDYLADICVQKIYFRSLCKKKVNEAIADSISTAGKKNPHSEALHSPCCFMLSLF